MLQVTETHSLLAPAESVRLEELELVIERGLTVFTETGAALLEVRDSRLYRETFDTFEDYCRERWGFSRPRAYQLIQAAEVVSTTVDIGPPKSERQARELSPLIGEPEVLREAWQEVQVRAEVEGKPVTAALVKEVVQEKRGLQSILGSSESNEWYTPARYIESARTVLGNFDLDPASCIEANEVVGADAFYTEADDGLAKTWRGRVWMNPPYGNLCGKFTDKLRSEYESGNVDEAILLVSAYSTETRWFQPLFNYTICFPDHRVKFWRVGSTDAAPTFGPAFIYLGRNKERFISEFSQYGAIVGRV